MELITLFSILLTTASAILLFSKLLSSSGNAPLPPGPTPLPIIGNLLNLDGQPHRSLARLAKVYGPIMSIRFGQANAIVVSSPESAREVLQTKEAFFSARLVFDSLRGGNHDHFMMFALPTTSPIWRRNRAICATNLISVRSLERSRKIRAQKTRDVVNVFHKKAGRPIRIGKIINAGLLNITFNVLFSQDAVDINSESPQMLVKLMKESVKEQLKLNISDLFPFLGFLDLQGRRRTFLDLTRQLYKVFDVIVDARLEHRRIGGENYGDFLDYLLDLLEKSKITRTECHVLLKEIINGGTDTTSITIEWVMAELLRHPSVMAKVQAEVREAFASQNLADTDVINLPYLQAVIKETMRLHPASLTIPRMVIDGDGVVDLSGYRVPKGTQVLINTWAIGRDSQVWNEPDLFRPERFLEKQFGFQGRDFEFLPFGSGRKNCPGMPFAVRVMSLLLATMLAEFDWRLPDGMGPKDVDMTEKFGLVLELAVPLVAVPMPVKNNVCRTWL